MKPLHSFVVSANLPKKLEKLKELAYNYWWCWNTEAKELFFRMDRKLWEDVEHNPILLINKLPQDKLSELAEQQDFLSFLDLVYDKFRQYIEGQTWFETISKKPNGEVIAYFSPEYGINESMPNYSGGLGILAGDHLKSGSDLGIPIIGVGLLYQQGYFRQHLTQHGWQNELYHYNDFFSMPILLMKDDNGSPIIIDVDLPFGKAFAQIWRLNLGRAAIYLMDTNIEQNRITEYRDITDQLYGGDRETRIQQEILLGIGGMKALKALNIKPDVVHINEGHAAFALLERTRMFMEEFSIDFHTAMQITKGSSIFTTHTPVPAGNETFRIDRIDNYLTEYSSQLGLSREEFLKLGQMGSFNPDDVFSMTILGLKLTAYHNGVSKLHGRVSRDMWHKLWKCFPKDEVPIKSITNGIHTTTWVAKEFAELYDRYLGPAWRYDTDNQKIWDNVDNIPTEEIWREKQRRRIRLVLFAREYLKSKQKSFLPPDQVSKINEYLDPDALTIGFARRFATYKRATLLFKDMNRLAKLLKNPERPVQIIIAGKAHPHDTAGKEVIQSIIQKVRSHKLERHVVFLEDYDMVIGRLMVKGCDIWLNNPIRPMEASGTSGMKASLNGTINFSVLDGWFDEAYNGRNGFAIGEGEERENLEEADIIESEIVYELLENQIIPMFYDRTNTRVPEMWVKYMKSAIKTIAGQYSTTRMLKEYTEMFYIPALNKYNDLIDNNASKARELYSWKNKIRSEWANVEIIDLAIVNEGEIIAGEPVKVQALVNLNNLSPEDVIVEVYYGGVDPHGDLMNTSVKQLELVRSEDRFHHYEGTYICPDTGMQGFTARVLPTHSMMVEPAELYLCCWANGGK